MKRLLSNLRRWSKREEILAVPDDRLDEWLDRIGLLSGIEEGEMVCEVCHERVDKTNLEIVSRQRGKLIVVCANPACVGGFLAGGREVK